MNDSIHAHNNTSVADCKQENKENFKKYSRSKSKQPSTRIRKIHVLDGHTFSIDQRVSDHDIHTFSFFDPITGLYLLDQNLTNAELRYLMILNRLCNYAAQYSSAAKLKVTHERMGSFLGKDKRRSMEISKSLASKGYITVIPEKTANGKNKTNGYIVHIDMLLRKPRGKLKISGDENSTTSSDENSTTNQFSSDENSTTSSDENSTLLESDKIKKEEEKKPSSKSDEIIKYWNSKKELQHTSQILGPELFTFPEIVARAIDRLKIADTSILTTAIDNICKVINDPNRWEGRVIKTSILAYFESDWGSYGIREYFEDKFDIKKYQEFKVTKAEKSYMSPNRPECVVKPTVMPPVEKGQGKRQRQALGDLIKQFGGK